MSRVAIALFLVVISITMAGCQEAEKPEENKNAVKIPAEETFVEKSSTFSDTVTPERQAEIQRIIDAQYKKAWDKRSSIPAPGPDPYKWIQDAQDVYGEYASPGTVFHVTNEGNCGAPDGGCTVQTYDINGNSQSVDIYISPSAIGSTHLLFHEIAHSHGVLDECMAEKWAHTVTDIKEWSYAECAPQ